jgi:LPS-assembly lipoprotein
MSLPEAGETMRSSNRSALNGRGVFWRSGALLALVASVAAGLAGCGSSGFHPLYAASSGVGGADVDQRLAQLDVMHIPGRVGQRIRNELIYQTTGGGSPLPPTMRLEIAIQETVTSMLVQIDGDANGQIYALTANFRLIRLSDKAVVLSGSSVARAPFERFDSIFSNVRAREDAENRAARTIGEDLRARLSAYLSNAA